MALTALTTLNIPGNTQSIIFSNPTQVYEIDFLQNNIVLKSNAGVTLSKSDFILFFNYLCIYYTALNLNFPSIAPFGLLPLPPSTFNLNPHAKFITLQCLTGNSNALILTYDFTTKNISFTAIASDITISLQEFFTLFLLITAFENQVKIQ